MLITYFFINLLFEYYIIIESYIRETHIKKIQDNIKFHII